MIIITYCPTEMYFCATLCNINRKVRVALGGDQGGVEEKDILA
jgi:hypothetical protein